MRSCICIFLSTSSTSPPSSIFVSRSRCLQADNKCLRLLLSSSGFNVNVLYLFTNGCPQHIQIPNLINQDLNVPPSISYSTESQPFAKTTQLFWFVFTSLTIYKIICVINLCPCDAVAELQCSIHSLKSHTSNSAPSQN